MHFARSREKKHYFSSFFASNFLLLIDAKLIEHIFSLFRFQNCSFRFFFVLFSLHFIFISLQMRKQAKKHIFRNNEAKKFRFRFASFRFEAKIMAVFRFRFPSFHFEAKMMALFPFFFVLFSLLCLLLLSLFFRVPCMSIINYKYRISWDQRTTSHISFSHNKTKNTHYGEYR